MMHSPREVVVAFHAAFTARDVDALCELYADDAINHQTPELPIQGRAAIRAAFQAFFEEFPNERTVILNLFEVGDWAIWEWLGGVEGRDDCPPFHGCGFFHVINGKIVFQRGYWDKLTFLRAHDLPLPTA